MRADETPAKPIQETLLDGLQRLLEGFLFVLLAMMVVIVFLNVVLRFVFHTGIVQTEELSRYAFVWLTFVGAVVVLRENGHLGMDSLLLRMSETARRACRVLSDLLVMLCCVLFLIGSWYQTLSSVGTYSQASSFPMVALFSVGLFASGIMILIAVADLWLVATGRVDVRMGRGVPHVD